MTENSFGQQLGKLIYQKRKSQGLTQAQLSEDAYETSAKTRRISELESGKVRDPHPKTIDPIIVALGITDDELEACSTYPASSKTELSKAYAEASSLLEKLADQYEHEHEHAGLLELEAFLLGKAREYFALKTRIQGLDDAEDFFELQKTDAMSALAAGEYEKVDNIIKGVEVTVLNDQTLDAIHKQSRLRIVRADAKYLEGDLETALQHYRVAARYYEHFDAKTMLQMFEELARRTYELERRSMESTFLISQKLLEEAVDACETLNPEEAIVGGFNYRLGLVLRNQAERKEDEEGIATLEKSITCSRVAVKIFTKIKDVNPTLSAQISLGNALSDLAFRTQISTHADRAIEVLQSACDMIQREPEHEDLHGHIQNSLGAAILRREVCIGEHSAEANNMAIRAYEQAITSATRVYDLEVWGTAQINLGRLLAGMAKSENIDDEQSEFIRVRAISCYTAAIETYPIARFPYPFAEAHSGLADVLFDHGLCETDELFELYFSRAIQSFFQAAEFFTEASHPQKWAHIQCSLGSIMGNHAKRVEGGSKKEDIKMAIEHFSNGLRIFDDLKLESGTDACERNIALLKRELRDLETDVQKNVD